MADGGRTQILVAIISVSGVIAAALIANSDKIFGANQAPATLEKTSRPVTDISGQAADAAAQLATSQKRALGDAAGALDKISGQIEAADTPDIGGIWHDTDGYRFDFAQQGENYSFSQYQGAVKVGGGAGSLSGRSLSHNFTTSDAGSGTCKGDLTADGRAIAGSCRGSDGQSWLFRITR